MSLCYKSPRDVCFLDGCFKNNRDFGRFSIFFIPSVTGGMWCGDINAGNKFFGKNEACNASCFVFVGEGDIKQYRRVIFWQCIHDYARPFCCCLLRCWAGVSAGGVVFLLELPDVMHGFFCIDLITALSSLLMDWFIFGDVLVTLTA